jgi:hypothetical protein
MLKRLVVLAAFGGLLPACTFLTAAPSVQGRAYVIRNEYIQTTFWNCDATSGEPVCYQTKKQFTAQPKAK